ncbi:MAG: hypothetical protein HKN75_04730 [Bacteroidia bacterium]|nr:hypothetical protein [Bacteroidia bacterium]
MKNIKQYILLIAVTFAFTACETEFDDPVYTSGSADLSSFVAVGNSLTAGFADAALYQEGQDNSFPKMLSTQFAMAGGGTSFVQPDVNSSIGIGSSGNSRSILGLSMDCLGETGLGPIDLAPFGDLTIFDPANAVGANGPFHNMGVPGAKSFHLVTPAFGAWGLGNPFYSRFASDPGTSTVIGDAVMASPTFFSLWIGNNDILGYATSGGSGNVGGTDVNDITDLPTFNGSIDAIIATMSGTGAGGVVANIPCITCIPFFTTIPYNGLELDAASAAGLTQAYMLLGLQFSEGANPFVIEDKASGLPRLIKDNEYILLSTPQDSLKCGGWGSTKAIPSQYIIDETEFTTINNYRMDYNAKLKSAADAAGLAFADISDFFFGVRDDGFTFNGNEMSIEFVSGGLFSLDGVHGSPRGYAAIANEMIKAINSHYNATIPLIDVNSKDGILFP